MFRYFSYYAHKIGGWAVLIVVVVIFLIGLQVVQKAKHLMGLAPASVSQQSSQKPQGASQVTTPTTANPAAAQNVPAGPTAVEIRKTLQEARDRLVESGVHADNALKSINDWNSEIPPLLISSAGDKIAEHEDLVASLTRIVKAKRTAETKLKDMAKRISTFRADLATRAASSTPTPLTTQEESEIAELHKTVSSADQEWNAALSNARAIKLLAAANVEPEKKRSLKEEIEVKAAEEQLAKFKDQERQELARRTEEAEYEREQEQLAVERKREKERLATKAREEAEAAAEEQRRKDAALLTRARSDEVQSTLAPFLHARDVQPQKVGGGSVRFQAIFEAKPMSLSALKAMGALEPTTEGLKWLARVGGHRKLSEPRWGIASQPNNWTDDDKKLLMESQKLLRELGLILVKDGKLSP